MIIKEITVKAFNSTRALAIGTRSISLRSNLRREVASTGLKSGGRGSGLKQGRVQPRVSVNPILWLLATQSE
jgi:hypothetical protein